MAGLPVLSANDISVLKELLRSHREKRLNNPQYLPAENPHKANEVYLIQVPCGGSIPAIRGDIPGYAECCLFRLQMTSGIDQPTSYRISPVYEPDGETQKTIPVYNIHKKAADSGVYWEVYKEKYGRWLVENPSTIEETASGSGSSSGAVTTTTEDPEGPRDCSGQCKFTWVDAENKWTPSDNTCAAVPTTTSTSTTTTTTGPCVFDKFTDDDDTGIADHTSDSGDAWTTASGSPVILGNHLQMDPDDATDAASIDAQKSDGTFRVEVVTDANPSAGTYEASLYWREKDANNYYFASILYVGGVFFHEINQMSGGVSTNWHSAEIDIVPGQTVEIIARHIGNVLQVTIPDVSDTSVNTDGHTDGTTARLQVISAGGIADIGFDNFESYSNQRCLSGCICVLPSTTTTTTTTEEGSPTTTSTSTTTTTTAVPGADCDCAYPTFCGTEDGECTYTDCTTGYTDNEQCPKDGSSGTTTTTPDISSCDCSTTTTPDPDDQPPECVQGCAWFTAPGKGWIPSYNDCTTACPCQRPPAGLAGTGCYTWYSPCVVPPPTTPPPSYCIGDCYYICNDEHEWILENGRCQGFNIEGTCSCVPPSDPCGECAEITIVGCAHFPPDGSTTSTTTTTKDPCTNFCENGGTTTTGTSTTEEPPGTCETGYCIYQSDGSASAWEVEEENCGECDCSDPPATSPQDTCERIKVGCGGPTTTSSTTTTTGEPTTTSTSTTTTTTENCCEQLPDMMTGRWCEDTNVVFTKQSDYVWTANGPLSCGDAFSATVTCHENSPDSSGVAGNCDDRFSVTISYPCATGFEYSIASCSCDELPIINFSFTGGTCQCECTEGPTDPSSTTSTTTTTEESSSSSTSTTTSSTQEATTSTNPPTTTSSTQEATTST